MDSPPQEKVLAPLSLDSAALALRISPPSKALAPNSCDEGRTAPRAVARRPSHESSCQDTPHAEPVPGDPFLPNQALPCECLDELSSAQYTPVISLITLQRLALPSLMRKRDP